MFLKRSSSLKPFSLKYSRFILVFSITYVWQVYHKQDPPKAFKNESYDQTKKSINDTHDLRHQSASTSYLTSINTYSLNERYLYHG